MAQPSSTPSPNPSDPPAPRKPEPAWFSDALDRGQRPERAVPVDFIVRAQTVREHDDGTLTLTMRASQESEDRYGTIVDPRGMLLERFRRNPVIPWSHNYDEPPVARADAVSVESGELIQEWRFPPADVYPKGAMIGQLYKHGYLFASSIGFMPHAWERREPSHARHGYGWRFTESELWETSSVVVPAHPEALVRSSKVADAAAERDPEAYAQLVALCRWAVHAHEIGGEELLGLPQTRRTASFQGALPLAPRDLNYDEAEASRRWRSESGSTESPSATYWRQFAWFDESDRENFAAYRFPFADVVGGRLNAVRSGVEQALASVNASELSDDDKTTTRALLLRYRDRFDADDDQRAAAEPQTAALSAADVAGVRALLAERRTLTAATPTATKNTPAKKIRLRFPRRSGE